MEKIQKKTSSSPRRGLFLATKKNLSGPAIPAAYKSPPANNNRAAATSRARRSQEEEKEEEKEEEGQEEERTTVWVYNDNAALILRKTLSHYPGMAMR